MTNVSIKEKQVKRFGTKEYRDAWAVILKEHGLSVKKVKGTFDKPSLEIQPQELRVGHQEHTVIAFLKEQNISATLTWS